MIVFLSVPSLPSSRFCGISSEQLSGKQSGVQHATPTPSFRQRLPSRITIAAAATPITQFNHCRRRCLCYDLFDRQIPYVEAWRWQKSMVEAATKAVQQGNHEIDSLLILQHPSVYTMGTRSSHKFLLFDDQHPPFDVYRTERGGEVTYHGPGQLVLYPILNLRNYKMDLHWYLRSLEEVVIRALLASCSLQASRIDGLTGVWVGDKKVAAIGVRVSSWITYHGFALNVSTNLTPFKHIIPCGIKDKQVGSVLELLKSQSLSHVEWIQRTSFQNSQESFLDTHYLLDMLHCSLLEAFSDVFGVDLLPVSKDSFRNSLIDSVK